MPSFFSLTFSIHPPRTCLVYISFINRQKHIPSSIVSLLLLGWNNIQMHDDDNHKTPQMRRICSWCAIYSLGAICGIISNSRYQQRDSPCVGITAQLFISLTCCFYLQTEFSEESVLLLVAELGSALDYLQSRRVIHRWVSRRIIKPILFQLVDTLPPSLSLSLSSTTNTTHRDVKPDNILLDEDGEWLYLH